MDTIFIRDLQIETTIGVFEWERCIRQHVRLDIECGADIRRAATTDALADTLSYRDVAVRVSEFVAASDFLLIEALAEEIAQLILKEFPTPWVRLSVTKPGAVAGASEVGVRIQRER